MGIVATNKQPFSLLRLMFELVLESPPRHRIIPPSLSILSSPYSFEHDSIYNSTSGKEKASIVSEIIKKILFWKSLRHHLHLEQCPLVIPFYSLLSQC